jgi:hypothetical protein
LSVERIELVGPILLNERNLVLYFITQDVFCPVPIFPEAVNDHFWLAKRITDQQRPQ